MIDGQWVAALIPARAGSKGLPGKNTMEIAGRPLIEWTILAALQSTTVDRVIVSSDDPAALSAAAELGAVPLTRPAELATDSAPASDVIRHAYEAYHDFDILVLLQPTSPLRTSVHIDEALALLSARPTDAVVSVFAAGEIPELMYRGDDYGRLQPVVPAPEVRRQDVPATYVLNGAIYAASMPALARAGFRYGALPLRPYLMTKGESVDIDDAEDFEEARSLLEARSNRQGETS